MLPSRAYLPHARPLEDAFEIIRREASRIPLAEYDDWPQRAGYVGTWKVYGLFSADDGRVTLGETCAAHATRCPGTLAALARLPGVVRAAFSVLLPGTHIQPHVDGGDELRCHLGLSIPERCGLRVAGEVLRWREGRCLVFDGRDEHEAANLDVTPRTVLVVGVRRDGWPLQGPRNGSSAGSDGSSLLGRRATA